MPIEAPRQERRLLGGAVKRIRKLSELTQDQLATACGIDHAYLSNLERGLRKASLSVMVRLAANLQVDLDDISYLANVYVVSEEDAA